MSEMLRKRSRELECLPDCTNVREWKRIQVEEMDQFHHLVLLDKTISAAEEECAPSEKAVKEVMRSLGEEIGVTSYPSSNLGDKLGPYNKSSDHEGQETLASDSEIDLIYLLEASDDELGIPLSPVLDLKDEVCQSSQETSECFFNSPDLESFGENWHFEDDFESYQQLAWCEDASDASKLRDFMSRDFISPDLFLEGDFSVAWTSETTCYI